jgi:transposase
LTNEEWQHVEPLIPPAKAGGRKREVNIREVVNGVMDVLSTGCQWRYLPKDLPPKSTVFHYFNRWNCDGTLEAVHYDLYVKCRESAERDAGPTADSQSVKSAEKRGLPYLQTGIVKRSDQAKGFVVLPKRWIVERTIVWLNRCRRLAKDF